MKKKYCAEQVPIFRHLDKESLEKIDAILTHRKFDKGENIFSPINQIGMFVIEKGKVKEYQLTNSGKEQLLRILQAGDVVGQNTLFSDEIQDTYVDSLEKTSICLIKKDDFKKIMIENPTIAINLLKEFSNKLVETEKQSLSNAYEDVNTRIASYILNIYHSSEQEVFELDLSSKELTNYLTTTPETIFRKLKEFESLVYIEKNNRKIKVLDVEKLNEYIDN
ncbi:MAG: Crp/Fnr family transcriptional regulator [Helcococcus sp.]|nr:Crp/Fnr family transcriptional regulator [Helcococcus sp.]